VLRAVPLLLPLLIAHPGHESVMPWCAPPPPLVTQCLLPEVEVTGGSQAAQARRMLQRGAARMAASLVAREAERSPEAADVLAGALRELGDAEGAARVVARFTRGAAPLRPDPAATGATPPPASPGTR
jgi:hypothetical protein